MANTIKQEGYARLATWNCVTINELSTLRELLIRMDDRGIDVATLQEVRITHDGWQSVCDCAARYGYEMFKAHETRNLAGGITGGLIIITKLHATEFKIPLRLAGCGRMVACRIHRPNRPEWTFIGIHLRSGNAYEAEAQLRDITNFIATSPGDKVILGDLNYNWDEAPAAAYLAAGTYEAMDSEQEAAIPTRFPSETYLDYGIMTRGMQVTNRQQWRDPGSDHAMVAYDTWIGPVEPCSRREQAIELNLEAPYTEVEWRKAWRQVKTKINDLLEEGNANKAWTLLSATAKSLMIKEEGKGGKRRDDIRPPKKDNKTTSKHGTAEQSFAVRRLLRQKRRREALAKPAQANSNCKRKYENEIRKLTVKFPELNELGRGLENDLRLFDERIKKEMNKDRQRRILK